MEIAFLGNFIPLHSTESHLATTLELLSHTVTRIQEGDTRTVDVPLLTVNHDLFVHTQTYDLAVKSGTESERVDMYARIKQQGIVTVGVHLDRWFDLDRETQLTNDPYFTHLDYLFTADGGNQDRFAALSINHHWSPPGVFAPECILGTPRPIYRSQLAFVGNWAGKYHPESRHRHELVRWLQRTYRGAIKFYPRGKSIRGMELSDLYASASIIIGDSCFSGDERGKLYWSDRISETLGRGGFLLHPYTDGLDQLYKDGEHLVYYEPFNWDDLRSKITHYLRNPDEREHIRLVGFEHVKANHTYTHRIQTILDYLHAHDLRTIPVRERIELRPHTPDASIHNEIFTQEVYRARPHITPDCTVVDLGANVGIFSIWAASLSANVIAVEPMRENLDQLAINISASQFTDRITVNQAAVGAISGSAYLIPGPNENYGASAFTEFCNEYETGDVKVITLDDLLRDVESVAVLKLDIEGAEYPTILAASESTLRKCQYITMEFHGVDGLMDGRDLAPGTFGAMVEKLARTHHVDILGHSNIGGFLFCDLYKD